MKNIVSILLTTLLSITVAGISAQPSKGNPGVKEIKKYIKTNIRPELIKQQTKFFKVLSADEIAEINKIKNNRNKIRAEMGVKNRKNNRKASYSAFNAQLEKIADAHPKEKEEYIKTMTAKKELWKKDIDAIKQKYNLPDNKKETKLMKNIDKPAFILMWNPNHHSGKKHHGKKTSDINKKRKKPAMEPGIKIFPYHATSTVGVKISGTKNKVMNVAVYDAGGKRIKELFNSKSSLPALNFSFDVSDWSNGKYFIKAKFDERTLSYDFNVEK